jgi:hypothetical protein
MGSSHSYVTDPNVFATEVKEIDDKSHWKSYDYVVVGGGAFPALWSVVCLQVNPPPPPQQAQQAQCLHPVSQRTQT